MITLQMELHPHGFGMFRSTIIHGTIWTTDDGLHHQYLIYNGEDNILGSGKIEKTQSGHRNPVDLLLKVMTDIKEKSQ